MAYFRQNGPEFRLSDVDEFIREAELDNSDGQKIMEYIRRKRGGGARMRLYDGSDQPIHFRLDHLQPVPAPQTSSNNNGDMELVLASSPVAVDDASVDRASAALIQPLAELSVENRVPSFVSPRRLSTVSPARAGERNPRQTIVTSPGGKNTLHVSPFVSHKSPAPLQKQLLLQQCKRRNELKCEALRQASHLVSSTPIAGEQSERRGPNLLNIRETISPVVEEQVPGTPVTHRSSVRNTHQREDNVAPVVAGTVHTPVPATQDMPDGTEQENDRENTPPREQNPPVVIPETPSPVRRSPRKPSTPLSGLSSAYRARVSVLPLANLMPPPTDSQGSGSTPLRRSILKNVIANSEASPRNRVSFSEKLTTVREIPPRLPTPESVDITSDDSEEEQEYQRISRSGTANRDLQLRRSQLSYGLEPVSVSPVRSSVNSASREKGTNEQESSRNQHQHQEPSRNQHQQQEPSRNQHQHQEPSRNQHQHQEPSRNQHQHQEPSRNQHQHQEPSRNQHQHQEPSRNQHQHQESSAGVEENMREGTENAHRSRTLFGRGRSNAFDEDECNGVVSPTSSNAREAPQPTRQSTTTEPARTDRQLSASPMKKGNNRTNRNTINMIMEEWDATAMEVDLENEAAGDDGVVEGQRTITETMAITNVATPRTVVMDILDPPSAFCDDDGGSDDDESSHHTDEGAQNNRNDPVENVSPKTSRPDTSRKRKQSDNGRVTSNEAVEPAIPSPKQSRVSEHAKTPAATVQHTERLVSVDSPYDHVPPDMIQAVDMIHSKVNSELLDPDPADGRRTTITMPAKRRTVKVTDADTETYFQTIEKTCSQEKGKSKKRKERRKLFVQQSTEQNDEESRPIPSPEPLPQTQELVDSQNQKPVQQKQTATKQLAVIVKRLTDGTIAKCTHSVPGSEAVGRVEAATSPQRPEADADQPPTSTSEVVDQPPTSSSEAAESPAELPVREKQNEEHNEKGDQSKDKRKEKHSSPEKRKTPSPQRERKESPKRKVKPPEQTKKKKQKKHKAKETSPESARSSGTVQKYLKDVSNEIRQQIDSEGPRRSHRSRRLADEILRNNPDMTRTDAPMYVMPTISDVLKYYQEAERLTKKGKVKEKGSVSKNGEKKKQTKTKENKESANGSGNEEKRGRGRPRKEIASEERFDADGFRIPALPSQKELPRPSKSHRKKAIREEQTVESFASPISNAREGGNSTDSGLSSAVMTNDDATVPSERNEPMEISTSSKQSTRAEKPSSSVPSSTSADGSPSSSTASSSRSPSAGEDMMAEKRKALDWMMMLMENKQKRTEVLPSVEIQGFTHLSLEHLTFHRHKGIDYSFYIYSRKDNFGFLRFLPNVTKKTTFSKQCSLKFLILNGSLKFIINSHEVNVVGGDFLMIPPNTTYSMVNGLDTTLMFMIKTTVMESDEAKGD